MTIETTPAPRPRPQTAAHHTRPTTAKGRPQTARPVAKLPSSGPPSDSPDKEEQDNSQQFNSYIQEIQKKLKSVEISSSPSTSAIIDKAVFLDTKQVSSIVAGKKPLQGLLEEKLPAPTPQTAHKRYSSVYPCSSKLLAKKWDDATWKKHKEKIKTMKACIDNVHSAAKPSTLRSLKKSIAKQENEKRIARENEILLERMARTFTKPSAFTNFEDAHSRTKKDIAQKNKAYMRKREQANEKIDKENEILLRRLETKKPNYEKKQWMVERKEHLRHLLNMTKFPEAYKTAVKLEFKASTRATSAASTKSKASTKKAIESYDHDFEEAPAPIAV